MKNKLAINGGTPICKKLKPFNTIGKEELRIVTKVINSGTLSGYFAKKGKENGFLGGKYVQEFEKNICDYFKVKYAITINSWTSGLQTAVGAIDIQPGDEVIVTPWTMCATVTAIVSWLAIPVFADIDPVTLNLSPDSVKKCITPKTKAIMVADIHGLSANMDRLLEIAKKNNLKIINDAAQAPGAMYKNKFAGTLGDIGGFSLNRHKHIQTGEGGVLVTNDKKIAERCRLIRNHAECIVDEKSNSSNMIGSNYRMGEIEAAIGIMQLKKLKKIIKSRQKIAKVITNTLNKYDFIKVLPTPSGYEHVYYIIPILYEQKKTSVSRSKLVEALSKEGLGNAIYSGYANIHLLPMFQNKVAFGREGIPWKSDFYDNSVNYKKGICPVAEDYHDNKIICFGACMIDGNDNELIKIKKIFEKVLSKIKDLN